MEQNILISTEISKLYKWILKIYGLLLILISIYIFIVTIIDISKTGGISSILFLAGMGGWFSILMSPLLIFGPSISNFILGYSFWRLRKWAIVLGSIYFIYNVFLIYLNYNLNKIEPFNFEWSLISGLNFFLSTVLPLIILVLAIYQRKKLTGKYFSVLPFILVIIILFNNFISSGLVDISMNKADIKYNSVEKKISNYPKSEKVLPYKLEEADCAGSAVNFVGEDNVENRIISYKTFLNNGSDYSHTHCYSNRGEFIFMTKTESGFDDYMNTTTVYIIKNNKPKKVTDFSTKDFKVFEDKNNFYFAHRSLEDSLVWKVYVFDEEENNFFLMDKFEGEGSKICRVERCYFIELLSPEKRVRSGSVWEQEKDNPLYEDVDYKNDVHLIQEQIEYPGFRLLQFTKDSMSFKVYENLINGTYKEGDMVPSVNITLPGWNSLNHIYRLLSLNKESIAGHDVYNVIIGFTGTERYKLFVDGEVYNVLSYPSDLYKRISEEEAKKIVENVIKNGEYKP